MSKLVISKWLLYNITQATASRQSDLNQVMHFCFALSKAEGLPPLKRSSPVHSFAIHDILGLNDTKSSKSSCPSHSYDDEPKVFSFVPHLSTPHSLDPSSKLPNLPGKSRKGACEISLCIGSCFAKVRDIFMNWNLYRILNFPPALGISDYTSNDLVMDDNSLIKHESVSISNRIPGF